MGSVQGVLKRGWGGQIGCYSGYKTNKKQRCVTCHYFWAPAFVISFLFRGNKDIGKFYLFVTPLWSFRNIFGNFGSFSFFLETVQLLFAGKGKKVPGCDFFLKFFAGQFPVALWLLHLWTSWVSLLANMETRNPHKVQMPHSTLLTVNLRRLSPVWVIPKHVSDMSADRLAWK